MSQQNAQLTPSDEALMEAYVGGDQQAFRTLFDRHAAMLLNMMRAGRIPEEEARDLAQQAFLQLHRARKDYRTGARLRPWLLTIAFNLKRDYLRRRGRRKEIELDPERLSSEARQGEGLDLEHRAGKLRAALAKLPADQREVIELHWYREIPFPEIAATMGTKLSTVKVRAHRGYKALRQLLAEGEL